MSPTRSRHVAAVVLIAVAGVATACGSDGNSVADAARTRADQARQVARDARLPQEVQDVLADAAAVVGETYTVAYQLGGEGKGRSVIAQDPPRRRIEFRLDANGAPVNRLFITNDDGSFGCTELPAGWRCQRNAEAAAEFGPLELGDVQQTTQDLIEAARDYAFSTERRTIAGVAARCLLTELKPGRPADPERGQRAVLCISPEGVPLLIEGTSGALTATSYRRSVTDGAFRLPAEPTDANDTDDTPSTSTPTTRG